MKLLTDNNKTRSRRKQPFFYRFLLSASLVIFSITAHAGKIIAVPSASGAEGFGGFNMDNIEVMLDGTGSTFDESTGAYVFGADSNFTYVANVYDDDVQTNLMGHVIAKPWPVGEPPGIKIVNDDFGVKQGRPTNCIMSTSYLEGFFLDDATPLQVLCSGPFQSHKRYKLAMLPITVAGGAGLEEPVDLVFNVEVEAGSRDYQVFQKIHNWTNARLKGFTVQAGNGLGGNFVPASNPTTGVGVANLSLSVPASAWSGDQLANFSTALFGPVDIKHDRPAGYFDQDTRAGYSIVEFPNLSGQTDQLNSGAVLPSDYPAIPPATGAGANQFGNWLPNNMLPYGIYFDDDGNPDTDAELVAWYGDMSVNNFGWMTGAAGGFTQVPDAMITDTWSNDPLYFTGLIDDLANIGLNYIVTVGDVSAFPNSTFTIRIKPVVDDSGMPPPTYVAEVPTPALVYASSDAIIQLHPGPGFVPGSLLTARVADADLNLDTGALDTTTVEVTTNDGSVPQATLTLEELGKDRGVFAGNLPDAFSDVAIGTVVTVSYTDVAGGAVPDEVITASSTAIVDSATPASPRAIPSSSDDGGWCSYNPNGRFDPILPGLILAGLAYLGWRLKKKSAR